MKKLTLIIFFLSLFININAQNSIEGMVSDSENNPLIGASIFLPELNTGDITDKDGNFVINSLPEGNVKSNFHLWVIIHNY